MRYVQVRDGEWFHPLPGHKMKCCDCGLVHRMSFRVRRGHVEVRAVRDNRSTAAGRRKK